jgi:hypothetical protein
MLTQDEYDEIMQRTMDKEMMIDILRIKLSDMTADRNRYRTWNEINEKWIDELEAMLINDNRTSNTTTNNNKIIKLTQSVLDWFMRFFAPITRRLRALFGAR